MAVPCHSQFPGPDGQPLEVREDCVTDRDEALDYFGTVQMVAYYNQNYFVENDFGD